MLLRSEAVLLTLWARHRLTNGHTLPLAWSGSQLGPRSG